MNKLIFVAKYTVREVEVEKLDDLNLNKLIMNKHILTFAYLRDQSKERINQLCPKEHHHPKEHCEPVQGFFDQEYFFRYSQRLGMVNMNKDVADPRIYGSWGTPLGIPCHRVLVAMLRNQGPIPLKISNIKTQGNLISCHISSERPNKFELIEVTIDTLKGYLPVTVKFYQGERPVDVINDQYRQVELHDIIQTPEGAFLPKRLISYPSRRPTRMTIVEFTELELKTPDPSAFTMFLPKGTEVVGGPVPSGGFTMKEDKLINITDLPRIAETIDKVGKRVKQREQERRDMGYAPDLPKPEPKSRRWYYIVGGAVLVLLITVWYLRWRRNRAIATPS
ncbi:MAG: hypothetical protein R3B84_14975 [Zavarzinella sp.]